MVEAATCAAAAADRGVWVGGWMSLELVGLLIHMASSRASCAALAASGCIADREEVEEEEKGEDDDEEEGRMLLFECAARTTRRKEAAARSVMVLPCCLCEVVVV